MKVKIKDLQDNPFRNIERYPFSQEKIEKLKSSIEDTSFWDNILARPNGKKYQIAYGHHRLRALRELKVKEVDIPVRDLGDATMLKIMANENMQEWEATPRVINETILAVKSYLEGSDSDKPVQTAEDIKAFLGDNWGIRVIKDALAILRSEQNGDIDREAVEEFESMHRAVEFRRTMLDFDVPKEKQRKIARDWKSQDIGVHEMRPRLAERYDDYVPKKPIKPKEPPKIMDWLKACIAYMATVETKLRQIKNYMEYIEPGLTEETFQTRGKALKQILEEVFPNEEDL